MDISFYDFDFNRLADFTRFISFNIEPQYCGYGTAEIHFSLDNSDVIELLDSNQYVFLVAGGYSAIVTGFKVAEDIAIYGRTCEWLLTRRGVESFSYAGQTPEEIARAIVANSAGDFVTLGTVSGTGEAMSYATDKVKVLHDVVSDVLKTQKLGFRLVPDVKTKQFIFSVYSGKESLVLLSQSSRTAYDMTYTVEKQDMATKSGWYERKLEDMGEWNAANNNPLLTNSTSTNAYKYYKVSAAGTQFGYSFEKGDYIYSDTVNGILKRGTDKPENVWVFSGNALVTGAKRWDAVLNGTKTPNEAMAELQKLSTKEAMFAETKGIEYGCDYNLGDIVSVQFEARDFKKSSKMRVSAVSIYFDVDKSGILPKLSCLEE